MTRRRPGLTSEQEREYREWLAAVESAEWDCAHGVKAGSLARPRPFYGPRCAICRAKGFTSWRRMYQLNRIPPVYL